MDTKHLAGKTAIISGSGRGIGRALALKLAAHGANVVVNDLDEAPAKEVVDGILANGGKAVSFPGNVTAPDFGEGFVNCAIDTFGGLDIIVNNAGYTHDGVIQNQSDDQFQEMLEVHVVAPFRILRAAAGPIRALSKRESLVGTRTMRKVVNVSSMSGTNGSAGQVNYSSAKSALIGMTRTMAKEWGRYGVCVNCVAFGFIDTRLAQAHDDPASVVEIHGRRIQGGVPSATRAALNSVIPLGRPGTAEEGAGAIYLFCIPESDYISGQVVIASGGMM